MNIQKNKEKEILNAISGIPKDTLMSTVSGIGETNFEKRIKVKNEKMLYKDIKSIKKLMDTFVKTDTKKGKNTESILVEMQKNILQLNKKFETTTESGISKTTKIPGLEKTFGVVIDDLNNVFNSISESNGEVNSNVKELLNLLLDKVDIVNNKVSEISKTSYNKTSRIEIPDNENTEAIITDKKSNPDILIADTTNRKDTSLLAEENKGHVKKSKNWVPGMTMHSLPDSDKMTQAEMIEMEVQIKEGKDPYHLDENTEKLRENTYSTSIDNSENIYKLIGDINNKLLKALKYNSVGKSFKPIASEISESNDILKNMLALDETYSKDKDLNELINKLTKYIPMTSTKEQITYLDKLYAKFAKKIDSIIDNQDEKSKVLSNELENIPKVYSQTQDLIRELSDAVELDKIRDPGLKKLIAEEILGKKLKKGKLSNTDVESEFPSVKELALEIKKILEKSDITPIDAKDIFDKMDSIIGRINKIFGKNPEAFINLKSNPELIKANENIKNLNLHTKKLTDTYEEISKESKEKLSSIIDIDTVKDIQNAYENSDSMRQTMIENISNLSKREKEIKKSIEELDINPEFNFADVIKQTLDEYQEERFNVPDISENKENLIEFDKKIKSIMELIEQSSEFISDAEKDFIDKTLKPLAKNIDKVNKKEYKKSTYEKQYERLERKKNKYETLHDWTGLGIFGHVADVQRKKQEQLDKKEAIKQEEFKRKQEILENMDFSGSEISGILEGKNKEQEEPELMAEHLGKMLGINPDEMQDFMETAISSGEGLLKNNKKNKVNIESPIINDIPDSIFKSKKYTDVQKEKLIELRKANAERIKKNQETETNVPEPVIASSKKPFSKEFLDQQYKPGNVPWNKGMITLDQTSENLEDTSKNLEKVSETLLDTTISSSTASAPETPENMDTLNETLSIKKDENTKILEEIHKGIDKERKDNNLATGLFTLIGSAIMGLGSILSSGFSTIGGVIGGLAVSFATKVGPLLIAAAPFIGAAIVAGILAELGHLFPSKFPFMGSNKKQEESQKEIQKLSEEDLNGLTRAEYMVDIELYSLEKQRKELMDKGINYSEGSATEIKDLTTRINILNDKKTGGRNTAVINAYKKDDKNKKIDTTKSSISPAIPASEAISSNNTDEISKGVKIEYSGSTNKLESNQTNPVTENIATNIKPGKIILNKDVDYDDLTEQAKSALLTAATMSGKDITVTSGFRTYEQQAKLYQNSYLNPYPVAPPGTSDHESGMAFDVSKDSVSAFTPDVLKATGLSTLPLDPIHFTLNKSGTRQVDNINQTNNIPNLNSMIPGLGNISSNISEVMGSGKDAAQNLGKKVIGMVPGGKNILEKFVKGITEGKSSGGYSMNDVENSLTNKSPEQIPEMKSSNTFVPSEPKFNLESIKNPNPSATINDNAINNLGDVATANNKVKTEQQPIVVTMPVQNNNNNTSKDTDPGISNLLQDNNVNMEHLIYFTLNRLV